MPFEQLPKFEKAPDDKEPALKELDQRNSQMNLYSELAKDHFGPINWQDEQRTSREWSDYVWWYFRPGSDAERIKKDEEAEKIQYFQQVRWQEHFDEICREYKIHLQPIVERDSQSRIIKDFRPKCVDTLLKAISENPALEKSINCFKTSLRREKFIAPDGNIEKSTAAGTVWPEIVVYTYGKNNFETTLRLLYKYFQGLEKYGSDLTPRDNYKINRLMYVAQSGGDFKNKLRYHGKLDRYFDKRFNYAFRVGEKPPVEFLRKEK